MQHMEKKIEDLSEIVAKLAGTYQPDRDMELDGESMVTYLHSTVVELKGRLDTRDQQNDAKFSEIKLCLETHAGQANKTNTMLEAIMQKLG